MDQCQAQARHQRVPYGQADRLPSALGAHFHRDAQRPVVRRETELGGKNGQNDSGTLHIQTHMHTILFLNLSCEGS